MPYFDVLERQENRGLYTRWRLSSWSGYVMRQRATNNEHHTTNNKQQQRMRTAHELHSCRIGAEWDTSVILMMFPPSGMTSFLHAVPRGGAINVDGKFVPGDTKEVGGTL